MRRWSVMVVVLVVTASCAPTQPSSPSISVASTPAALLTAAPSATPSVRPDPVPTATAEPTPTPTPDPAYLAPATAHGWRPVPEQRSVVGAQWQTVTWTGDRFLAASHPDSSIESRDGILWTEAQYTSGLPAGAPRSAKDAASGAAGWVAVGTREYDGPCASYCPPVRGLVWTSTDGDDWTAAPRQSSLVGAELDAVEAWRDGYVAAGAVEGRAAVWWSDDGLTWARRWVSPDQELLSALVSLAPLDDEIVAGGWASNQDTIMKAIAIWSADGRQWSNARVQGARSSQIFAIGAAGSELLAAGPSSGCPGGVWSTADGKRWVCQGDDAFGSFTANAAAGSPTIEVVVGFRDKDLDGAIWWRPRPE